MKQDNSLDNEESLSEYEDEQKSEKKKLRGRPWSKKYIRKIAKNNQASEAA